MTSLADAAQKALLYEVVTFPKPGLVDFVDSGSHPDMTIYLFIDSTLSLKTYFRQAEVIGQNFKGSNLTLMFQQLRQVGKIAEKTMFAATKNINTHKGAIFSLGIFVCAESYCLKHGGHLFDCIRQMLVGLMASDLKPPVSKRQLLTAGQKQFYQFGLAGIRGQAQAGYPIVEKIALPFLRETKGTLNERLVDTLMKIASQVQDSTLIKRAHDPEISTWLHEASNQYLALGASQTKAGRTFLVELNHTFFSNHYSIGGCADLLILTIFVALRHTII